LDLEKLFGSPARIRLLKYILDEGQANITRIARETGLHHRVIRENARILEELGIIEERKYDKLRIYTARLDDPRVVALRDLIREIEAL